MRRRLMLAALCALAAALLCTHLRLPRSAQVYHLAQSGASARSGETMAVSMPHGTVQVNRASPAELDQLPGVGPALAREIIAEREKNGFFHYPEDLVSVRGIGPKTLERMREQLKLP